MKLLNTLTILIYGSSLIGSAYTQHPAFLKDLSSFTTDFYQQVASATTGNVIVSPFSAQAIVSVALQGAVGLTAEQMITGLQFDDLLSAYADYPIEFRHEFSVAGLTLIQQYIAVCFMLVLAPLQNNPSLKIANKLYLQQGYNTKAAFNDIIAEYFFTSAELVNFAQSVSAANEINNWVASETNNLINDLISPSDLNSDTRMVLVNAIYFKGIWSKAFNKQNTYADTFNTDSVTSAEIPFMHHTDTYNYAEPRNLNAKVLELKYFNSTMSMIVILPNNVDGLAALEKQLNTIDLQALSSGLKEHKVAVSLPKFKTSFSVTLNDALSNMGMPTMFNTAANFSNMLQQPESLHISSIVQKAYIKVNEEGTEAAAATGITMTAMAMPVSTPPVLDFNANHPFIYFLQENNECPYFIGRFMNKE